MGSFGTSPQLPLTSTVADEEEDAGGEFADGMASLQAQNRALQADLQDKNRYIATLEKRLLQARRSSHSRMSMGFSKHATLGVAQEEAETNTLAREKDLEIADLRARLDDQERMVTALRSAARKRDIAQLSPETSSSEFQKGGTSDAGGPGGCGGSSSHQSSDSNSSSLLSASTPMTPISPMAILSPQKKNSERKRKSVNEMSKMLDGMIQEKVESGQLVKGRTGSVRVPSAHVRHGSGGPAGVMNVPAMGSMVSVLRDRDSVVAASPIVQ